MDLLIKNGTIVNGSESFKADIAVENGKITQIGTDIAPTDNTKVVDVSGKLVLPGAIDTHASCNAVRRHDFFGRLFCGNKSGGLRRHYNGV